MIWRLHSAGGVLTLAFVFLSLCGNRLEAAAFTGIYFGLWLVYAWVIKSLSSCPARDRPKDRSLIFFVAWALLFRIILLGISPIFDDDIYRYVWDGRVWSNGINPYYYPPNSYFLEELRWPEWASIGYKEIPTVYPPAAQLLFRLSHEVFGPSIVGLKCVLFMFDCANMSLIALLLRRLKLPPSNVLVYAWSPIVIWEFAAAGHIDVAALTAVLGFLYLFVRGYDSIAFTVLSLGVWIKLFPAVLFGICFRRLGLLAVGGAGLVSVLLFLPFVSEPDLLIQGTEVFVRDWLFNDALFGLLHSIFSYLEWPELALRMSIGGLVLGLSLSQSARTVRQSEWAIDGLLIVLSVWLLLSPVINVWYVCWLVPLLCFRKSAPIFLWTGLSILSYTYYINQQDYGWVRFIEYGGVIGLLVYTKFQLWERR